MLFESGYNKIGMKGLDTRMKQISLMIKYRPQTNDTSKKAKDHYIRKLSQRMPKGLLLSRLKEVKTGCPVHSRQRSKGVVDSGSLTTAVRAAKITNAYS